MRRCWVAEDNALRRFRYEMMGKLAVRRGDQVLVAGTVTLDPTKKPKASDLTLTEGENKEKRGVAIYELTGDTFRLCAARPGEKRPTEFSAKAGSGQMLIVYKREKK
jgi:uncharacterized protein (TIGR03067 family)